MPVVIPLIAAAASYGGTAALIGGSFTVANIAAGLTMLGSVLSIAGTVTKNEKLSKIGNGLMIVGGATSIINSLAGGAPAGAADTAASTAESAATPPTDVATAGKIAAPPSATVDTGSILNADSLAPQTSTGVLAEAPPTPLIGGESALSPATASVANAPAAPTPLAAAAPTPGPTTPTTPTGPPPGIIASYLKDNAAGVTLLGQGIMGAYGQQQTNEAAKRKVEEERRIRDFEEQRRQGFNASVTGSRIQLSPWQTAPTPNAMALPIPQPQPPGSRPLIGTVRRPA